MHMDLRPSMLSLAGMPGPEHFQGRVLFGPQKNQPRDYVCSARDRLDNCNEVIRTIRTEKYRYIRDFLPHRPYAPLYPDGGFFREVPPEGPSARDFWETSCLLWEQKIHDPDGVFLMPISEDFKQYLVRQIRNRVKSCMILKMTRKRSITWPTPLSFIQSKSNSVKSISIGWLRLTIWGILTRRKSLPGR